MTTPPREAERRRLDEHERLRCLGLGFSNDAVRSGVVSHLRFVSRGAARRQRLSRLSRRGWAPGSTQAPRRGDGPPPRAGRARTSPFARSGSIPRPRHSPPSEPIAKPRTYSSPRRGPTCERGRFGEEARSGSVSQAGSVGGERAVESRVGVARARRFATHFFSHRRTRPVMTCACVRAASRWPRVDMARPRVPANPKYFSRES